MRDYAPFYIRPNDFDANKLLETLETAEGWLVEYKSQMVKPKDIAKTIASFANTLGGWVFYGVKEGENECAASFPGIAAEGVKAAKAQITGAVKESIQPQLYFEEAVLSGPIFDGRNLLLAEGRVVIVVYVPSGPYSPYIHRDGRVYHRVGGSSDPKHLTDRAGMQYLLARSEGKDQLLEKFSPANRWDPRVK